MDIKLEVTHDKAEPYKRTIVSGSKNYYRFTGVFTEDWDGLDKFVVFPDYDCAVAFDANDMVVIPEAIVSKDGELLFGVIGKDAEGELRIATNISKIDIAKGTKQGGSPPPLPAENTHWEEYVGELVNGTANGMGLTLEKLDDDFLKMSLKGTDGETCGDAVLLSGSDISVRTLNDEESPVLVLETNVPDATTSRRGFMTAEQVNELKRAGQATKIGSYIWYIDSDTIMDAQGNYEGNMSNCMNYRYAGCWFYVRTTGSEAGVAAYPERYSIDGANGYLSLRDYVIWTGSRLVHIPTYEAKSSTLKNNDGKWSPKSGVDGLMSATDKAYLTDLIKAYWNTLITETSYNANNCLENGLYAPMVLGRPAGAESDERLGLWVIKDKTNGGVVQIAVSFNHEGRMWMRSSATNSADNFTDWKPVLSGDTAVPLFRRDENGGNLPNWLIKGGVYHGVKSDAGNNPADVFGSQNRTNWTIAATVDPDNSNHVTQRAYNNEDAEQICYRTGNGTGGAGMWENWSKVGEIADGSITTAKIANGAVTHEKIADGAIGSSHLGSEIINSHNLNDNAVTEAKLSLGLQNRIRDLETQAASGVLIITDDDAPDGRGTAADTTTNIFEVGSGVKEIVVKTGNCIRLNLNDTYIGQTLLINSAAITGSDGVYIFDGDTQITTGADTINRIIKIVKTNSTSWAYKDVTAEIIGTGENTGTGENV